MKDIEKILTSLGLMPPTGEIVIVSLGKRTYYDFEIADDLNAIRELELLVIEKVGAERYGRSLFYDLFYHGTNNILTACSISATADAPTRIAAMLAALEGNNDKN